MKQTAIIIWESDPTALRIQLERIIEEGNEIDNVVPLYHFNETKITFLVIYKSLQKTV